jgi:PAS domain S-box-containing protein
LEQGFVSLSTGIMTPEEMARLQRLKNPSFAPAPMSGESGMVLHLADGTIQACNKAAEKILGLTLEQLQGWNSIDPPWQTIHADGSPFPGETHPAMVTLRTGQPYSNVVMGLYKPTGEFVWLLINTEPLLGVGSKTWAVVSTFTKITEEMQSQLIGISADVTERQSMEAELRENRATLQRQLAEIETIYQSAPIGLSVLDTDLRFVRINQRLAEINGLSVEAHIGRTVRELLPDLADTAEEVLRPVLETGEPRLNVEIRGETPAQPGVQRVWLEHFLPLKDGDRVIGISIVCEEITERKQAEVALRESEERFRNMADNAPVMVWVTDSTGYCTYLSQSWYEFTAQTEATGLGFGWLDAVHPEEREVSRNIFLKANECHEAFRLEYRVQNKDGEYRWAIDSASPWFGEEGEFKGFIGSVIDISDRKQAEAARERLLQQEQVAREQAEQANRIKDEFLTVLSHELRTPLNPILGWTKLLQTRKFDETKIAQALATIERNTKLQIQLVDDLLDLAKILRGKLSLNVTRVNLSPMIEAAIETVRTAGVAKSISFYSVLPNIGLVSGDAARLQQIVWNLLSNAIKFTPEGGQVSIEVEKVDTQAQIKVSDTGKGISPDFLPYIFESFRQEDASTTRKYGGLGLGLAIVRHLVEAHGGTISADSPGVDLGATFTVRLPLLSAQPEIKQTDELHNSEPELTGIRVLAVDDEPDTRELLTVLLTEYKAEVMTVTSAAEVLANLEFFQPDVLVCDIGMPNVDGYSLMRQVRALPPKKGGQTPAIALTAYATIEDEQRALSSGYQRHLKKPLEPEQLVQAVLALAKNNSELGIRSWELGIVNSEFRILNCEL